VSERYNPKKILRARSAAIAAGASATPVLYPTPATAKVTTPVQSRLQDMLCRAHNQPWRSCTLCSTAKSRP
jgi:hypothetical protein